MRSFIQLLCNILRFCYTGKVLTFNFIQYIQTRFNVKIIHNIIMVVKTENTGLLLVSTQNRYKA